LNAPISLSPPGSIEEKIEIRVPERYILKFMFERDGVEFKQLKNLIGAMAVCLPSEECSKGVPVPIRWSLMSVETGVIVSSGEVESLDSDGWSAAHVYRAIGIVQAQPAEYIFKAEIMRPVPELAHIRTHIAIQEHSKSSTTWQMGLVWWGSLVEIFLAWPVAIYASILLLWRVTRYKVRQI
jgi:hypothetical protein